MKIVFFTDMFFPQINGVITSLATIAAGLAKAGHEVVIFIPQPAKHQKINWHADGVKIEMLPSFPVLLYPDLRAASPVSLRLLNKLRKIDPDIIHFQTPFLIGGGSIFLGKLMRKPILGSFHGYFMEPEYLKIAKVDQIKGLSSILWNYCSWFYNQCDGVLTFAQSVKKDLLIHKIRRPIHVIPNAISEYNVKKVDVAAVTVLKNSLNLKSNVVLYVGRLSPEKSLDILIESFAKVVKEIPDASLLIVGDGPSREKLEKQAKDINLTDHIVFTGTINSEDLLTKGYFQVANVFATASTSEVQPVSLIEAMYFHLPIVGVAKRGVGDMVNGVGLLAKPENTSQFAQHIIDILTNPTLRESLEKKSEKKYTDDYSLAKVVSAYEEYYQSFIRKNEPNTQRLHQRIIKRFIHN